MDASHPVCTETPGNYQVIGIRVDGERTVISNHTSREVAEKIISLNQNPGEFTELKIEPEGWTAKRE